MSNQPITYKAALRWLAENDDNEWLGDGKPSLSIGASLLMEIYKKTRAEVINDLIKAVNEFLDREQS